MSTKKTASASSAPVDEIEINGEKFVKKSSVKASETKIPVDKGTVIIRADRAGVFCGQIVKSDLGNGGVVVLKNARRFWYWSGAASLSQLAIDGTSKPAACKFPCAVPEITVAGVIEIIPCTPKAIETFNQVPVWKV